MNRIKNDPEQVRLIVKLIKTLSPKLAYDIKGNPDILINLLKKGLGEDDFSSITPSDTNPVIPSRASKVPKIDDSGILTSGKQPNRPADTNEGFNDFVGKPESKNALEKDLPLKTTEVSKEAEEEKSKNVESEVKPAPVEETSSLEAAFLDAQESKGEQKEVKETPPPEDTSKKDNVGPGPGIPPLRPRGGFGGAPRGRGGF